MRHYVVVLTACFDAESPAMAAQDFREWVNSQHSLSVTVTEETTGDTVELEV